MDLAIFSFQSLDSKSVGGKVLTTQWLVLMASDDGTGDSFESSSYVGRTVQSIDFKKLKPRRLGG
jgi:hypothetical protein